jgi:hypothetical protein
MKLNLYNKMLLFLSCFCITSLKQNTFSTGSYYATCNNITFPTTRVIDTTASILVLIISNGDYFIDSSGKVGKNRKIEVFVIFHLLVVVIIVATCCWWLLLGLIISKTVLVVVQVAAAPAGDANYCSVSR